MTLVIAAGADLLTPGAKSVAQAIPGAKLVVVEGGPVTRSRSKRPRW